MNRDWKKITKKIYDADESVLLSNPDLSLSDLPEGAMVYKFTSPVLKSDEGISLRELRSFLWKHRKDRAVLRDRAVIWHEDDTYGIGVVTTKNVIERLADG